MKHAGDAALDSIEPLLSELRQFPGIRERKRGVFYRKSEAFIHFHEDPAGIFADVRREREWSRLPVHTRGGREAVLRVVREALKQPS
jgi:hypothetical protein